MDLLEKTQEQLKNWKSSLEHLNMQLHLGATETKDEFEKQKKELSTWIHNSKIWLAKAEHFSEEKLTDVKTALEELRLQAALGKAETEDEFKEQQKNISNGIHKVKVNVNSLYSSSEKDITHFAEETGHMIDDFHTRFDLFRLQFHLAKKDGEEAWEEKKKEISSKLHSANNTLEKGKKVTGEKWDNFSTEISSAWDYVKKAFY